MAVTTGKCPSCGADIEFHAGASSSLVCPYCKHLVVRTDREDLESLGRVADVTYGDDALAPGDRGKFRGRPFVVQGRLVLAHPEGGTWEEYYAIFDANAVGWIAQAQGRWSVTSEVQLAVPSYDDAPPGTNVDFGVYGPFVVAERSVGKFLSAEGELPFAAAPDTERRFVDLSGPDGQWATIDYGDDDSTPRVFVGFEAELSDLGIAERGGPRPGMPTAVEDVKCPQCGAPSPTFGGKDIEHFACPHCGAIFDRSTFAVMRERQRGRNTALIALGTQGRLYQRQFTVIGYMERSGEIEGDRFRWSEYLLYEKGGGYCWLVYDEGVWWFGSPLPAGQLDLDGYPTSVGYQGRSYSNRNTNDAVVEYVLGEFYWKVEIGETVAAADYESGYNLVSREATGTEVTWTFSQRVEQSTIETAFSVDLPHEGSAGGGGGQGSSISTSTNPLDVIKIVVIIVFIVFWVAVFGTGSGGGSSGGGGFGGGSGGK